MELPFLPAAARELTDSARVWEAWGMTISPEQAVMLVRRQAEVLRDTGRVDFGGGVLKKLAEAFCDSPYIQPCDWADTLAQLMELFYALKNETRDQLGDDTLIAAMAARFNSGAGGSLDALAETAPAWFLRFDGERSAYEP